MNTAKIQAVACPYASSPTVNQPYAQSSKVFNSPYIQKVPPCGEVRPHQFFEPEHPLSIRGPDAGTAVFLVDFLGFRVHGFGPENRGTLI